MGKFGQVWTSLDKFGQFWTSLVYLDEVEQLDKIDRLSQKAESVSGLSVLLPPFWLFCWPFWLFPVPFDGFLDGAACGTESC